MIYEPDRWIVFRIEVDGKNIYKVLAAWYGGYLGADSWRINSSVVAAVRDDDWLEFTGHSGSVYRVYEHAYGTSMLSAGILKRVEEECEAAGIPFEVLDAETDWEALNYE